MFASMTDDELDGRVTISRPRLLRIGAREWGLWIGAKITVVSIMWSIWWLLEILFSRSTFSLAQHKGRVRYPGKLTCFWRTTKKWKRWSLRWGKPSKLLFFFVFEQLRFTLVVPCHMDYACANVGLQLAHEFTCVQAPPPLLSSI